MKCEAGTPLWGTHYHVGLVLREGNSVLVIDKLPGHRRPETTLKYTHPSDATLRDAAETVAAGAWGLSRGDRKPDTARRTP